MARTMQLTNAILHPCCLGPFLLLLIANLAQTVWLARHGGLRMWVPLHCRCHPSYPWPRLARTPLHSLVRLSM